jgi:rod shape-determining protein MreD
MSLLLLLISTYCAAVLETSLAGVLEVRGVVPDLFALVAMIWMLTGRGSRRFLGAAAVGLAYDLTSGGPLGIGIALFALVGFAIGFVRGKIDANHLLLRLVTLGLAATAIAASEAVIWRLFAETTLSWSTLAMRAAIVGLYTTGVGLPVLMVLGWTRNPRQAEARLAATH